MRFRKRFLALLYTFVSIDAWAGSVLSSQTSPSSNLISPAGGGPISASALTPAPIPPYALELRKRAPTDAVGSSSSGVGFYNYACATADGNFWGCNDHGLYCAATILGNSRAYQYCSNSDLAMQVVLTTFIGVAGSSSKPCPTQEGTGCCYDSQRFIQTNYFVASGYTVTAFNCQTEESTATWNPFTNVLNPSRFSTSLAQATAATTSSGPSYGAASNAASSTSKQSSSPNGLSSGAKIGIGVGIGAGVGIVLIATGFYFGWRRRKERITGIPEVAASQQAHDPHASYDQGQYYPPGTTPSTHWSSHMSTEPKYHIVPAAQEPVEAGSDAERYELPENGDSTRWR